MTGQEQRNREGRKDKMERSNEGCKIEGTDCQ